MNVVLTIVAAILALAATAAFVFFLLGPDRVWERVAGPADQGEVDFAALRRRATPNDSLACSPGACAGRTDLALPFFERTPAQLMAGLDAALRGEERLTRVDDRADPAYRRYVARTKLLQFPDTIDAKAVAGSGGTALMLYSRSLLGRGDMGVNRRRLEDWAARLAD